MFAPECNCSAVHSSANSSGWENITRLVVSSCLFISCLCKLNAKEERERERKSERKKFWMQKMRNIGNYNRLTFDKATAARRMDRKTRICLDVENRCIANHITIQQASCRLVAYALGYFESISIVLEEIFKLLNVMRRFMLKVHSNGGNKLQSPKRLM